MRGAYLVGNTHDVAAAGDIAIYAFNIEPELMGSNL